MCKERYKEITVKGDTRRSLRACETGVVAFDTLSRNAVFVLQG